VVSAQAEPAVRERSIAITAARFILMANLLDAHDPLDFLSLISKGTCPISPILARCIP
jgi:hypothetical protein